MSYGIFYNKLFIKLNDGTVIPMILMGSSNCYDYNGKRERSWQYDFYYYDDKNKLSEYPEMILKNIEKVREEKIKKWVEEGYKEEDIFEHYGWYIGVAINGTPYNCSFKKYYNFYKTGIEKAKTIEELKEMGIYLFIYPYISYSAEQKGLVEVIKKEYISSAIIESEEQLLEIWEKIQNWEKNSEYGKYVYYHLTFNGNYENIKEKIRKENKKNKEIREKKEIRVKFFYTIYSPEYGYLYRYINNGFKYSFSPQKKFLTEKEANKYLKQLEKKKAYKWDTWQIKKVEKEAVFYI